MLCPPPRARAFCFFSKVADVDDGEEFGFLVASMAACRIGPVERAAVLRLVAGVLLLGNVGFRDRSAASSSGDSGGGSCGASEARGDGGAAFVEGCEIEAESLPTLAAAAELLGLTDAAASSPSFSSSSASSSSSPGSAAEALGRALVTHERTLPNGEAVVGLNSASEAADLRNALAKVVYASLFDWLVGRVNAALADKADGGKSDGGASDADRAASGGGSGSGGSRRLGSIGVLDIFGFEDMASNGFEQLFINTTNEALQHVFNGVVFKAEAAAYDAEGIVWDPLAFPDNTPTVELLEKRPLGLLPLLDSECHRGAAALDGEALVRAFAKVHGGNSGGGSGGGGGGHPSFAACGPSTPWRRNDGVAAGGHGSSSSSSSSSSGYHHVRQPSRTTLEDFAVIHYAGPVVYTVVDFVPKNRDALFPHVRSLLAHHGGIAAAATARDRVLRRPNCISNDMDDKGGAKAEVVEEKAGPWAAGALLGELFPPLDDGINSASGVRTPIKSSSTSSGGVISSGGRRGSVGAAHASPDNQSPGVQFPGVQSSGATSTARAAAAATVAGKFLGQLAGLKRSLAAADVRFVRCVKTNDACQPQRVDRPAVLRQLVCGGVMAALEVRRAGFPTRMPYAAFLREFRCLEPGLSPGRQLGSGSGEGIGGGGGGAHSGAGDGAGDGAGAGGVGAADAEVRSVELLLQPIVLAALGPTEALALEAFRPGATELFLKADAAYALHSLKARTLRPKAALLQVKHPLRRTHRHANSRSGDKQSPSPLLLNSTTPPCLGCPPSQPLLSFQDWWRRGRHRNDRVAARWQAAKAALASAEDMVALDSLSHVPAVAAALSAARAAFREAFPAVARHKVLVAFAAAASTHAMQHAMAATNRNAPLELVAAEAAAAACAEAVGEALKLRATARKLTASKLSELEDCDKRVDAVWATVATLLSTNVRGYIYKKTGLFQPLLFSSIIILFDCE